MSFDARVFRILIASPSDVTEERDIAVQTIQAWNDLNSAERQLVLLPLRWETHSAPEYGRRPQEVINRQVVDHSDLVIGLFWTRIGSPTGQADSGTLEEIERVALKGKPVMLYFSQIKQDPDRLDLEQLQRLREFKQKTFPKALVEHYTSQIDFRDKLSKQLEIQLRSLLASEGNETITSRPITDIQMEFADPKSGNACGQRISLSSILYEIEDEGAIPDYGDAPTKPSNEPQTDFLSVFPKVNRDYYREMVRYISRSNFFQPVRFWLKNVGAVGARDVYVDIRVEAENGELSLLSPSDSALSPPGKGGVKFYGSSVGWFGQQERQFSPPEKRGADWSIDLELRALQPQREVIPPTMFVVGAESTGTIVVTARIYADTLSVPVTQKLFIDWKVDRVKIQAAKLLQDLPETG